MSTDDLFTNEALADEELTEELMPGETLGMPIEEIAAAEVGYPTVPAAEPTNLFQSYTPISLTDQIPLEYSASAVNPYAATPAAWGPLPTPPVSRTPRIGTFIWGLIFTAVGVGLIASALGNTIDYGLALIWLLACAGFGLLIAATIAGRRRRRTDPVTGLLSR